MRERKIYLSPDLKSSISMLKKKSLARKLLEYKLKKRKQTPASNQASGHAVWHVLLQETEEQNANAANNKSGCSIKSETDFVQEPNVKIEVDASLVVEQVDKDNNQGNAKSPAGNEGPPIPANQCQSIASNHCKITKESTELDLKSNKAVNDVSFEYRVITRRSKSKKITKSFCGSPKRQLEPQKKLLSVGRVKQFPPKKKPAFNLQAARPLYELRAAVSNYCYTRKRSLHYDDQDDLIHMVESRHKRVPRPRPNDDGNKHSLLAFASERAKAVVPCFVDSSIHSYADDKLQSCLIASKRDEDCDSSDSVIKFTIQQAYKNLKNRVGEYQKQLSLTPIPVCHQKAEQSVIKLKDGWVQVMPKNPKKTLQENSSVKRRYEKLLKKTEDRARQLELRKQASFSPDDALRTRDTLTSTGYPPK